MNDSERFFFFRRYFFFNFPYFFFYFLFVQFFQFSVPYSAVLFWVNWREHWDSRVNVLFNKMSGCVNIHTVAIVLNGKDAVG